MLVLYSSIDRYEGAWLGSFQTGSPRPGREKAAANAADALPVERAPLRRMCFRGHTKRDLTSRNQV